MSKEREYEGLSGIFIAEYKVNNMDMERIVVSDPAIKSILKVTKLSPAAQEDAVMKLVDRTPNWMELAEDEETLQHVQMEKIKTVLTQETILAYLEEQGVIRDKVDTVEVGIDHEGSIVVYAYYTNLNREQRRMMDKIYSEQQKAELTDAFNKLGSEKIVDLASKKIEKLKKEGKDFRGKKLK